MYNFIRRSFHCNGLWVSRVIQKYSENFDVVHPRCVGVTFQQLRNYSQTQLIYVVLVFYFVGQSDNMFRPLYT